MPYSFGNGHGPNVIVIGDPISGFQLVGPFESPSAAIEWASTHTTETWWEANLITPQEYTNG